VVGEAGGGGATGLEHGKMSKIGERTEVGGCGKMWEAVFRF